MIALATPTLVDTLADAGLTGRGGAGFATARKIEAAHRHGARLVVNACDGEIGAAKDAWVVEHHLEDLVHGASLVSPHPPRYAAHRGSDTATRLRAAGLDVLDVPARYVSSEESALVRLAAGGTARPVAKRRLLMAGTTDAEDSPLPPTVVLNAETVLRIAQIDRWGGPSWFRSFGTPDEPGPMLVTVTGAVGSPSVVEVEAGMPVRAVLDLAAGALGRPSAVGIGGLSGGWLTWPEARDATWSAAYLRRFGLRTGPGVLHVLDESECLLDEVVRLLDYAAGESAGQCGPCMFGVPAVASDVRLLATGAASARTLADLLDRLAQLPDRGACRFPDGVAGFTRSALRVAGAHLPDHAAGRCPSAMDRSTSDAR